MPEGRSTSLRELAGSLNLVTPRAVADTCLRYRYEESPDLVAYIASDGDLDYSGVLDLARRVLSGDESPERGSAHLEVHALDALVRLMAGRQLLIGDFAEPADLSQVVRLIRGDTPLDELSTRIEGQVNLAEGRRDHVRTVVEEDELDEDTHWILTTELAHPAHGAPPEESESWLDLFNRRFLEFGQLPITLAAGPGAPFDRIRVEVPADRYVDGPLVTVVMAVFKPDQSFRTAVESLTAQTWRNLEILVFDDCSPPEYDELLQEVTSLDSRITFTRMPENGGTYVIRNTAIARARGEFIAFQDSDDWAHPERIERQVRPLIDDPSLVSTHCRCVRVFDDLHTLSVGMNSFRRGEASTVFRKDVVVRVMGGFDDTRKAADNEFYERVEATFGEDANIDLQNVLVATQLTPGSLSRDEFRFSWHHPARASYVQARGHWHRQIQAGKADPMIGSGDQRSIPAPHLHRTGRDAPPATSDVLWMADLRGEWDTHTCAALVAGTVRAGWGTLVAHAEDVRNAERKRLPFSDDVLGLQAQHKTRLTLWPEETHATLLLVADPVLLALTRPPDEVGISADRIVIIVSGLAATGKLPVDPAVIERNAERMFGTTPEWLPAHVGIAERLRDGGATTVLDARRVMPPLQVHRRLTPGLRGGDRLVVGVSQPGPSVDLVPWLPAAEPFDVRVRMGGPAVKAVPYTHREGWLRFDRSMTERDFLAQLDVFVALPNRAGTVPGQAFTAMAEGAVVLAQPEYEPLLGAAAVYASADGAEVRLKELVADPAAVDDQRQRGYAFIESAETELKSLISSLMQREAR